MTAEPATSPLDNRVALETPEHVSLSVSLAGPAARGLAWAVDSLLRLVVVGALAVPLALFGVVLGSGWSSGVMAVVFFLLDWAWFAAWESIDGGRTPGKRLVGLRVIRADGGPIGAREAMIRNLLRVADMVPGPYLVGVLVSMADPKFRRVGDLVAGTLVVREGEVAPPAAAPAIDPPLAATEVPNLPRNRRIGTRDRQALEDWMEASARLGAVWSEWVASRVGDAFAARYRVHGPTLTRTLHRLVGAARAERPELEVAARWGRDEARGLKAVLDAGVSAAHPERASELVWRLRAVVAELGRIREGSPARAHAAEELVWRAEVLLHRYRPSALAWSLRPAVRLLFDEFPAALRRQARWFWIATALFYGPAVYCGVLVFVDADLANRLVPPVMQVQLEESFLEFDVRSVDDNAAMAGFYVWNNVGIALRAAGAGVLAGVGTAWVLVSNGISIGGAFGYCARIGALGNLLRFTSGHSAWELTAITVAGASGLSLGAALLVPGPVSRVQALRERAPDALRLAAGAAAMLVVAAAIEGFWSAWGVPDLVKGAFAAVQALLVVVWLAGWGRR